jgi:hypothetical protein
MSRHGFASRQPGGTGERHFDGINFKQRKLPDFPQGVRSVPQGALPEWAVLAGFSLLHQQILSLIASQRSA